MNFNWKSIYTDGSSLNQYNDKGEKNGYENIDRTKLKAFAIFDGDKLLFKLHLEPEQRLIYRRRNFINPMNPNEEANFFYMVGWQQKIGSTNTQSINYVYPDGHIEQAGIWAGGEPTPTAYEKE